MATSVQSSQSTSNEPILHHNSISTTSTTAPISQSQQNNNLEVNNSKNNELVLFVVNQESLNTQKANTNHNFINYKQYNQHQNIIYDSHHPHNYNHHHLLYSPYTLNSSYYKKNPNRSITTNKSNEKLSADAEVFLFS